eukprot:6855976-Ditylum_brightwellii.AAC.1
MPTPWPPTKQHHQITDTQSNILHQWQQHSLQYGQGVIQPVGPVQQKNTSSPKHSVENAKAGAQNK